MTIDEHINNTNLLPKTFVTKMAINDATAIFRELGIQTNNINLLS